MGHLRLPLLYGLCYLLKMSPQINFFINPITVEIEKKKDFLQLRLCNLQIDLENKLDLFSFKQMNYFESQ